MSDTNIKCKDLIGQKFGRLTVVDRTDDFIDKKGKHYPRWICNCDCGFQGKIVRGKYLTNNSIKSCGCLRREAAIKNGQNSFVKQYNKYDLSGSYGIGFTSKGEKFFFDLEDYDKIKNIYWRIDHDGYVLGVDRTTNNKNSIRMNQLVMNITSDSGLFVDHIHTEYKYDNRKNNLRIVTRQENNQNHKIFRNNTSGCTGVSWNKSYNKWESYIWAFNKKRNLGFFDNKEDAIIARKNAEIELWGDYAYKSDDINNKEDNKDEN